MKRSVDMHFVHTCVIVFVLTFSFFNKNLSQKNVKVIEDGIYDKLLEIYKGTEKVVLANFVEATLFSGIHFF